MENTTIPTQPINSVNQNNPIQPSPVIQSSEHSQKSPLIILVAISFLVIGGVIGYVLGIQNSKPVTNQMQTVQPTQTIQENEPTMIPTDTINATNKIVVIPNNYVTKETLCYTYSYPPGFETTQDNSCYQVLRDTNQSYVFSITFDPLYKMTTRDLTSLDTLISNRVTPYTIIQSTDISFNTVPAKQIIEKDENSPIKLHQIRTFIYLPNKYDRIGRKIVGFEIRTIFNENDDTPEIIQMKKDTLQTILSSIVWK